MRTIVIAGLLAYAAAGAAYAADDSLDRAAKKTANGFGELLKGMGQYAFRDLPLEEFRMIMELSSRSIPCPTPKKSPTGASTLGTSLPS